MTDEELDKIPRFHPLTVEVYGPTWHDDISHGLEHDHDHFLVKVIAVVKGHRLVCALRPMVGSEIIHTKLRGHSRDEVLRAYGVVERQFDHTQMVLPKRSWWKFW